MGKKQRTFMGGRKEREKAGKHTSAKGMICASAKAPAYVQSCDVLVPRLQKLLAVFETLVENWLGLADFPWY